MSVRVIVGKSLGVGFGDIDAGQLSDAQAQSLAKAARDNLVDVAPNAPSCCIDGRPCAQYMNGEPTEPRASVAGGALVTAYAAAELAGWFTADANSTAEKLAAVTSALETAGIVIGGHCDDVAISDKFVDPTTGAAKTGCGANDKYPVIIKTIFLEPDTVQALTHAMLDSDYNVDAIKYTQSKSVDWNAKHVFDVASKNNGGKNNQLLLGKHAEKLLIVNKIKHKTVDRDAFIASMGEQAFIVDMWYIDKLADALASGR